MGHKREKPTGLKISELARLAGVSIPTIKHYLKAGLLPRPTKTGRTMCYYDKECVERVRLIKKLQTERFLPLGVIKKIIESGNSLDGELVFSEALMSVAAFSNTADMVRRGAISKHTGYSLAKIDRMEVLGLIHPRKTARGKEYDAIDCQIISLMQRREEAGLPFEYSLEMMSIYRRHIHTIVKEDAKFFVRHMLGNTDVADAARYIREGDRALGPFMPLIRTKLARGNAERIVDSVNSAGDNLKEALRFRTLRQIRKDVESHPQASRAPLWLTLSGLLHRSRLTAINTNSRETGLREVARGLRDLSGGQTEEALARFEHAAISERVRPLAATLTSLAHIESTTHVAGLLATMHVLTEALSSFDASRQCAPDTDTEYLTSYFRGVGLAVIPEVFDTHDRAAIDLQKVITSRDAAWTRNVRSKLLKRLICEIKTKARYFLALVYLQDELYESAEKILAPMKTETGFYGRWARKKLRDLNSDVKGELQWDTK